MKAKDIIDLLHRKHPTEKFLKVEECKIGSSHMMANCRRFDMWVMARSWAKPRFIGYEVKVNRHDFINDSKWQAYLPYCTEFYFVAPPGVIDKSEVPESAGLLVAASTGSMLLTKKKAPVRNVTIPNSILIYILMARVQVVSGMFETKPNFEVWKERLTEIKEKKRVGWEIGQYIRDRIDRQVRDVITENRELRKENQGLAHIQAFLDTIGLSAEEAVFRHSGTPSGRLREALGDIPFDLLQHLKSARENIGRAVKTLEEKTVRHQ